MTTKPSYRLQKMSIPDLSIDTARFARYFYACIAGLILLLVAQTSFAAIAYRGFAQAKSGAAAATPITSTTGSYGERTNCGNVNPSIPPGSVNDLLVAQVIARRNAAVVTMPGWNILFTDNVAGQNYQVFLFWRKAVGGDPNTITQAGTCNHLMAYITRFGNVDTTTPLETQPLPAGNWTYANANVVASGTQSVTVANSMLVLATFGADDGVVTEDPSFTQLYDIRDNSADDAGFSLNTRSVAAIGSYGPFTNMAWSRGTDPVHGVLFAVRPGPSVSLPTLTVARPAGTSTGDVMVASIAVTTSAVGISAPPGWTVVQDSTQTQGGSEHLVTYWKAVANIGSEPATYMWTFSASHAGAVGGIVSFSGVDTASPVVASGARLENGNNATAHTAPSVVATANNMLVTVHSYTSSGTWTPDGAMTERVDVFSEAATGANGVSLEMSHQLLGAAGATGTRTATASNNGDEGVSHALVLSPGLTNLNHIEIQHASGSGLTCAASTLTVKACADSAIPCVTPYTLGVSGTLSATGTPAVNWDGTTGGAAGAGFVIPSGSSSVAKNVQVATAGTVVFGITVPIPVPTGATACNFGAPACTFTADTAGFIFSSSAGGAVATIPVQTAGTASGNYYLRAVKTSTTTQACEAALSGANTVNLAYECNNPATCSASNLMSINGGTATTIARNNNGSVSSYTSVNMTFDANGNAPFTLTFSDVGLAKLYAAKAAGGSLLTPLAGASNSFVTAPYDFLVVPTGPYSAGVSFGARVTPRTSGGATTPNFGLESAPETVVLKPVTAAAVSASNSQLVGPVGGQLGTLTTGSFTRAKCVSPASSGEVCDTALAWTEVGALLLSAATANGSGYLGSAKVPWGSVATGPFKPSFLTTELDTAQPCGTFTYSGQPFRIKVNAMSAANAVLATSAALTQNYTGAYAQDITLGSDSAGVCTPTTTGFSNNTLLGTAFPANTGFASSAPVTNTVAPLPVTYTQSLAAPAVISVCAKDTDAVNSHGQTQAVLAIRNGRLRLLNAYGSELLPLRVPVRVEYFNGTTWALNTADNCTSLPANTIVLSGGISGNTSASVVALTAGSGTLILTKPSPVATGSVDLAANLGAAGTDTSCNAATPASTAGNLQWLQFPWCAGKLDPNARVKFGSPKAPYIYLRERY